VLATASNLINLFLKCVCHCLPTSALKNRYWQHIQKKDLGDCLIQVLFPVLGTVFLLISHFFKGNSEEKTQPVAKLLKKSLPPKLKIHAKQEPAANAPPTPQGERTPSSSDLTPPGTPVMNLGVTPARPLNDTSPTIASLPGTSPDEDERDNEAKQVEGRRSEIDLVHLQVTLDQISLLKACNPISNLEEIRSLLEKGVNPNFEINGKFPLMAACIANRPDIMELLIDAKADEDAIDEEGNTPFMKACELGYLEIVEKFPPAIKDINRLNHRDLTALGLARWNGATGTPEDTSEQAAVVRHLLEYYPKACGSRLDLERTPQKPLEGLHTKGARTMVTDAFGSMTQFLGLTES
jgi:hypothetical protein